MSKTPSGRPVAPGVDPITPVKPDTENESFTSTSSAPAPTPAPVEAPKPGVDTAVSGTDPSTVEMVSVKTTGAFTLMDPFTGRHFDENSAVETPLTSFIQTNLDNKRLEKA